MKPAGAVAQSIAPRKPGPSRGNLSVGGDGKLCFEVEEMESSGVVLYIRCRILVVVVNL